MIEITAEIRALIDKAAAGVELAGDEYIDPADGLIHCKKCGGQRQTVVPCFGKPGYFMPRCICQCQREAEEQRKAAEERQRRMERIKRRKAQGLQDRYLYDYTFANDNGQNPLMDKARAYVENWKEAYQNNTGLLLFGDVGTGKSLLMCDKEAIEVQKILPFLSDTWPLCRIGRAVIRASQSCRQSCNKSQCPACGCRSHHSCTHAPQFSRSFPAREWGSVLQRQGACGQCP